MIDPRLEKRFVNSIEYLRKMDFFKDYSNLSSKEIFERILNGEMDYETKWFAEKWSEEERKWERKLLKKMLGAETHGQFLKESLESSTEYWMKASEYEVDFEIARFDIYRVFLEDPETVIKDGICEAIVKKLARVSRGFFSPTDIKGEILDWRDEPPPELKQELKGLISPQGYIFKVNFKFRGKEYVAEFYSNADYLYMDLFVRKVNELIKDTGYQYYWPRYLHIEYLVYMVFSEDEARKLKKERNWKLSLP
ncbi:MAG: hypothetical protein QXU11_04175 [Thermoproteota archaeon]